MAKELYSVKVEGETKEDLNRLTEKYVEQGLISEKGDLLNLATELLERNLSVQTPRHTVGIEELDQLTTRINRLFVNMVEQNNTSAETMRTEFEEKYEKAKVTVDSLLEEKQDLKARLIDMDVKLDELTEVNQNHQEQIDKILVEIEDKNKYIRLLEGQNDAKDLEIKHLEQFREQNKELTLDSQKKDNEIEELLKRIAQLEATAEQQKQAHHNQIRELEFEKKEAIFAKEKELTEQFNKELSEIRKQRDEFVDKHEERFATIQEKYHSVVADKQQVESLYQALKAESEKKKGSK